MIKKYKSVTRYTTIGNIIVAILSLLVISFIFSMIVFEANFIYSTRFNLDNNIVLFIINWVSFAIFGVIMYWYIMKNITKSIKKLIKRENPNTQNQKINELYDLIERQESEITAEKIECDRQKKEMLNEHRQKVLFLSQIYKDTSEPMQEVKSLIEVMGNSKLDASKTRYVNVLKSSILFIDSKLKDIDDFTNIEAGEFIQKFDRFNLSNLLLENFEYYKLKAEDKNIELSLIIPENFWPIYKSDSKRISQILSSLLTNAIEFTEGEGGLIELEVKQTNRFGSMANVSFIIRDTGIGIKLDTFNRMFDKVKLKYHSISNTSEEMNKSGFLIIKKMAKYMGGTIKVESSGYKNGIQFVVTLPLEVMAD